MIAFFNEEDECRYNEMLASYNRMSTEHPSLDIRVIPAVEVMETDSLRAFMHPFSIAWTKFYGTFEELKEKLINDFPRMFPPYLEFYTTWGSGIII